MIRIFNGATAIVTGGASGIGRALIEELARRGCKVVLVDLQIELPDYLQPVAQMLVGHKTITYDERGTGTSRAMDGDYIVAAHVADLESIRKHPSLRRGICFYLRKNLSKVQTMFRQALFRQKNTDPKEPLTY